MKVRIQTPPNPDPGRLTFYVDQTKAPKQKNPSGTEQSTGGLTGEPVALVEAAAPATDADGMWLYSKDVGGIAELFVKDGGGNEIQVTTNGAMSPAGSGGSGQFWPTQVGRASFDMGANPAPNGTFVVATGIILAPPPGQASLFHFRGITAQTWTGPGVGFLYLAGWVAFDGTPGTPDARVSKQFMYYIPGGNNNVITIDTTPLPKGGGCSVLPSGELMLHFSAPLSGDTWMAGSIAVTMHLLPANLDPPPIV